MGNYLRDLRGSVAARKIEELNSKIDEIMLQPGETESVEDIESRITAIEAHGMVSQDEAARAVGAHRITWVRWEQGHMCPSLEYIRAIADWSGEPLQEVARALDPKGIGSMFPAAS